jgi:hypothetical protein
MLYFNIITKIFIKVIILIIIFNQKFEKTAKNYFFLLHFYFIKKHYKKLIFNINKLQ